MMFNWLQKLGSRVLLRLSSLGAALVMLLQSLLVLPGPRGWQRLTQQLYVVGVQSFIIIFVSAGFIGMVLGLQGYTLLVDYGSEQAVGQMVALTLVRELAPVVAALLFAGRAGSALTAELGLMKATEQLASLEMFGVDPLHRIVAPRFIAGLISLPILVIIFNLVGVYGGHLVAVEWLGVHSGAYWGNMQAAVDFSDDVMNGLIKALVFATLVTWTALYQGYTCVPTSQGISEATTRTVVYSSLMILGFDFILTALMFGGL